MKSLGMFKFATQAIAAQATGRDARQRTSQVGQQRMAGLEHDFRTLPVNSDNWEPMQDEDGGFFFMIGFSEIGSDDGIGG